MRNNKVTIAHRFDPIGFEVDLFFRCTKFTLPGITIIGHHLFNNLYRENVEEIKPKIVKKDYQVPEGHPGAIRYHYYDVLCTEIEKSNLKGIGENYKNYYLINKSCLPDMLCMKIKEPQGIYNQTIDFLNKYHMLE